MTFVILRYSSLFWWILISFTPFALLWRIGDFLFYPIARKIAWRDLPKVANKLGLEYSQSTSYSEFGMLSGKVNGYQVFISPDSGHLKLHFQTENKIKLSTERSATRPMKEMPDFKANNWKFNTIFKTRRASLEQSRRFSQFPEITNGFVSFYTRSVWHLSSIYIDENELSCSYRYGQPFFRYLPASTLEKMVYELVGLAQLLDGTFLKET